MLASRSESATGRGGVDGREQRRNSFHVVQKLALGAFIEPQQVVRIEWPYGKGVIVRRLHFAALLFDDTGDRFKPLAGAYQSILEPSPVANFWYSRVAARHRPPCALFTVLI